MANTNFDQLMKRYLTGQVSEQEKAKIEAWLEVMKTEDTTDLELSKEDEENLFQRIVSSKDNVKEIEAFFPSQKTISPTTWILRIAASLLIISFASFTVWYFGANDQAGLETSSKGGVEKIILNDGTLVWLRGNSKLAHYNKDSEGIRYTELDGEALFEVAKDTNHPFIIQCGEISLKVLGTSFSVKTRNDSLELKVLTGKVNISLPNNAAGINVEPNEKVLYTGNGKLEKLALEKSEALEVIANTEYNMQFINTTLDQAFESIEKKFDVTVKLADRRIRECRITVDLTDRSLENSLQMIAEVLNIQYEQEGKTITVNGNGCK